jgi:hypothetical protein
MKEGFKCRMCPLTTKRKFNLKQHIETKHDGQEFNQEDTPTLTPNSSRRRPPPPPSSHPASCPQVDPEQTVNMN